MSTTTPSSSSSSSSSGPQIGSDADTDRRIRQTSAAARDRMRNPISVNLTPMIDVTFLLIVFFILVTQFTNVQVAEEVRLPKPEEPATAQPDDRLRRLIVNVIPEAGSARDSSAIRSLRYGLKDYLPTGDGVRMLAADLAADGGRAGRTNDQDAHRTEQSDVEVDLRADRTVAYGRLYPVLQGIMSAGFSHVNLVVNVEPAQRNAGALPGA